MNEISLHKYLEQIEGMIEQGRYEQAIAHGRHILKQYPKDVATYRLLGRAMLEAGQDEYAADMFRRVLSAVPEDLVAWVGMSEVHNKRGELDAATWCLERAFEMAPDNEVVAEELRHLYGRRDGVELKRVQLTRGALARLYLKGDLLSRAISEFRALLAEHPEPERVDLRVALAEALWRNEQRLEAAEVCQQVLDALPYCLKANLILGEIWTDSGREDSQAYLRRAEALDPENQMAQEFFGAPSPLPAREVGIAPLEYRPPTEEKRPAWMAGIEAASVEGPTLAERETALFDFTAAAEAQIEIPDWLEEGGGEEVAAPAPLSPAGMAEEQPSEETVPAPPVPMEEVPEWLAGIREGLVEEESGVATEEEVPEWLTGLGLEPIGEEEEEQGTGQVSALGLEPTGVEEAPAAPGEEALEEWQAEPGIETAGEQVPPSPSAELPPDWLSGIRALFAEEPEAPEEAPAPITTEEAPLPVAEEAPLPAWLEGEGVPSGDEALAWLEQLAAGKEEELRAQAQAEGELRMAEIMGRVTPAEVPPAEPAPEEAIAPPVEEAAVPPSAEPFGWTQFGELEAPPEAIAAVEEAPPIEEAPWEAAPEIPLEEATLPPAEEVVPPPVVEEVPAVAEVEVPEPLKEAVAPPKIPIVEEAPAEPFAAERTYLKAHPRDYKAWLALAQALWQAAERQEALEAYTRVIRSGKFLDDVIADLEECLIQWPDVSTQRVLGDAYMKDGRLQEALDVYRRALETL